MKIHPLFDEYVEAIRVVASRGNLSTEQSRVRARWEDAGKPVVVEEESYHEGTCYFPPGVWARPDVLAEKDAQIKRLKTILGKNETDAVRMLRSELAEKDARITDLDARLTEAVEERAELSAKLHDRDELRVRVKGLEAKLAEATEYDEAVDIGLTKIRTAIRKAVLEEAARPKKATFPLIYAPFPKANCKSDQELLNAAQRGHEMRQDEWQKGGYNAALEETAREFEGFGDRDPQDVFRHRWTGDTIAARIRARKRK
jgi:hypothetical protein